MQLITLLSAASAMVATASARSAVELNEQCNIDQPHARIVNQCDYPVHLWSVLKGEGCPDSEMVTLKTGQSYNENFDQAPDGVTGVSIKISKTDQCKGPGSEIVQLEYFLAEGFYSANFLDVSYVDCPDETCPTAKEGFCLISGSQQGDQIASADNTVCPKLQCSSWAECSKMAYVNPDDKQTKSCKTDANLTFYLCGPQSCGGDYGSVPAPSSASSSSSSSSTSSSSSSSYKTPKSSKPPKSSAPAATSTADYNANAPAVTAAPEIKDAKKPGKVKTNVETVIVTAFEYVNAKRHAHGHARRHQPFHA